MMRKAASVVALAAPVLADICDEGSAIQVEPLVFSGTPNPQFQLNAEQRDKFCDFFSSTNGAKKVPTCRVVGFIGWQACSDGECNEYRGEEFLDHLFMAALETAHSDLPDVVLRHIMEEIQRLGPDGDANCTKDDHPPRPRTSRRRRAPTAQCDGQNRGSDDPNEVHYDDEHDADGCFVAMRSVNNCYDYSNDIATNTFSAPGRGSGVCPENPSGPCVEISCEAMKNAAISDGLQWMGGDLPTELPEKGHYVSLHIIPDIDFHWLRMNADGIWSHKPGTAPVRDYDNNRKQITNPHEADLGFPPKYIYVHCGYMLAIPSVSQIIGRVPELLVVA